MRGGTASCTVIVSDRAIGSPIVDAADIVIALNPPSLARYEPLVRPGGLLVINASLIEAEPRRDDIEVVRVPCSAIAGDAGDDRLVSVAALGAALARRPLVSRRTARRALRLVAAKAGRKAVERNLVAFDAGYQEGERAAA
jgi:2-oxoglutarate ferredoxin oxidoreductase subunit gamma